MSPASRAPQLVVVCDDTPGPISGQTMAALAPYHPVAVRWGAQVAPLVRLVDPRMVIVAAPRDAAGAATIVSAIRDDGFRKPVLAVVHGDGAPAEAVMRDAGATVIEPDALLDAVSAHIAGPDQRDVSAAAHDRMLYFDNAVIDLDRGEVLRDSGRHPLARRERSLLTMLHRHAGAVVSRTEIIAEVWGDRALASRVVDRLVLTLRRRIERDPRRPRHLVTVFDRGYRLDP